MFQVFTGLATSNLVRSIFLKFKKKWPPFPSLDQLYTPYYKYLKECKQIKRGYYFGYLSMSVSILEILSNFIKITGANSSLYRSYVNLGNLKHF